MLRLTTLDLLIAMLLVAWVVPVQAELYFFHNDHLGTPHVITDEKRNIVWHAEYAPFGKTTVKINTIDNNLRFPGQYFDQESGLFYNWSRYYDPAIGRYITSDPIGLAGGLNTYGYVNGNPINFTDSDGLVIDALADIGFIGYDVFRIAADNVFGSCDNLGENVGALGADIGGLFIPFATGFGATIRGGKHLDEVLDAAKSVSEKVLNRANHVFGSKSLEKHNLGGFLGKFSGDQVKAFQSLEKATQKLASQGKIDGVFESVVKVKGVNVTVRGKVVDGTANIGTAFIP